MQTLPGNSKEEREMEQLAETREVKRTRLLTQEECEVGWRRKRDWYNLIWFHHRY